MTQELDPYFTQNVMEVNKQITDALRYMKVPSASQTSELVETVRRAFENLEKFITPRCIWGRFRILRFDGGIEIEGANIESENIAKLTSRSSSNECYILAATLGHEVDRQISIAQQKNMLDGLALDSCASVKIDLFCDFVIKNEIIPGLGKNEKLTSRFSPGYGDLKINVTEDILQILNATKRIGLSTTNSLMMSPIKSITAIIGIIN